MEINKLHTIFWAMGKCTISLLALVSFSCNQAKNDPPVEKHPPATSATITLTTEQIKTAGIELDTLGKSEISEILDVNGVLDVPPQNLVTISAMTAGFIHSTKLLQGQKVKKGDVLAEIKNPDFITMQQEYLSNRSRLHFLETEANRQAGLSGEQITSKKVYEQALSEFNSLKATQAGLKEKLSMLGFNLTAIEKGNMSSILSIRSPISGSVTVVNVNLGKYVQPQDLICEIVNSDHLHAELSVFEKDLGKIKVGQHLDFILQSDLETIHHGHIYLINQKLNPDRTVRVHAHIEDEDKNLIPNQILQAKIHLNPKLASTIPTEAIINFENSHFVFIVEKKSNDSVVFKRLAVLPGQSQDDLTAVSFPKAPEHGTSFVVKGAHDLLSVLENKDED